MKKFLDMLLLKPNTNSRFIALMTGVVTSLCTLVLVFAFVKDPNRMVYPEMLTIVLSGGVIGGGVARYLTKKNSEADVVEVSTGKPPKAPK